MQTIAEYKKEEVGRDIQSIYVEMFPKCASYIAGRGGNLEDSKDIFHDALILFMDRQSRKERPILNEEAYIMTLVKNLWYQKGKKHLLLTELNDSIKESIITNNFYPDKKELKLLNFLTIAGKKCMDLLRSFYFEDNSVKEIAVKYNFNSVHSASAQKYKCIEKLRSVVKEKSIYYDDFE